MEKDRESEMTDSEEKRMLALQPGQVLQYDYRTKANKAKKLGDTFRVVDWNIERGSHLNGIVATLRALDADIILLQEVDIDCRRSGYVNVAEALARELHMQIVFVCEVEELDSEVRYPENSVGPLSPPYHIGNNSHVPELPDPPLPSHLADRLKRGTLRHFHGNAILSKHATLSNPHVIKHEAGIDWEVDGLKRYKEPRHGFRSSLRCVILPKDRQPRQIPPLYLYTCHLEVFCGPLMRVRQLSDCMADATQLIKEAEQLFSPEDMQSGESKIPLPAFIIAGDMNTMANGLVRFSRLFGTDRMRILGIGETEGCWLERSVLSRGMTRHAHGCCPFSLRFPFYLGGVLYDVLFNNSLVWRYVYGFSKRELDKTDNTVACFFDPADKYTSVTLNHPHYHGGVAGKLDWMMLSNLSPAPFRSSPSPVDVKSLRGAGYISDKAAQYLDNINTSGTTDAEREATMDSWYRNTPSDGYLLFNNRMTTSDHFGLVMTVKQQATGHPHDIYKEYGARYTSSPYAVACFALTRPIVLLALGWLAYRHFRRE